MERESARFVLINEAKRFVEQDDRMPSRNLKLPARRGL